MSTVTCHPDNWWCGPLHIQEDTRTRLDLWHPDSGSALRYGCLGCRNKTTALLVALWMEKNVFHGPAFICNGFYWIEALCFHVFWYVLNLIPHEKCKSWCFEENLKKIWSKCEITEQEIRILGKKVLQKI